MHLFKKPCPFITFFFGSGAIIQFGTCICLSSFGFKPFQLFAYDTVKKQLTPKTGEEPQQPIPASLIAGAVAGISSTLVTYPLELLKTRLTVQVYAFVLRSS